MPHLMIGCVCFAVVIDYAIACIRLKSLPMSTHVLWCTCPIPSVPLFTVGVVCTDVTSFGGSYQMTHPIINCVYVCMHVAQGLVTMCFI